MPSKTVPITSVQESVTRPVALAVIKDLFDRLAIGRIDREDKNLVFLINGEETALPRAAMFDTNNRIRLPQDTKIEISITEDTFGKSKFVRPDEEKTSIIFADDVNRIYVKPIYMMMEAKLSIKVVGSSRNQVINSARMLQLARSFMQMVTKHEVAYHYNIPDFVSLLIANVHLLRESVEGYDQTLKEYRDAHAVYPFSIHADLAGNRRVLRLDETSDVTGRYEFGDEVPKPEREDGIAVWAMSFDYTYWYSCPTYMHVKYPITIHNQLLRDVFLDLDQRPKGHDIIGQSTAEEDAIGAWKHPIANSTPANQVWHQPYFDDWQPDVFHERHYKIAILLAGLSADKPNHILNLKDTEHFKLSPHLVNYSIFCERRVFTHGDSVVQIRVYHGQRLLPAEQITIDDDLNIGVANPTSLRDQYHVTVSILRYFSDLRPQYRGELIDYGCFFKAFVALFYPVVYGLIEDMTDCTIDPEIFEKIVDLISTINVDGSSGAKLPNIKATSTINVDGSSGAKLPNIKATSNRFILLASRHGAKK